MELGKIDRFGMYDSKEYYPSTKVTQPRPVVAFELEFIKDCDKDSIAYINGKAYHLTPSTILVRKPEQTCNTRLHFKAYFIHLRIEKESPLYAELSRLPNYFPFINGATYQSLFEEYIKHNARNGENVNDFFSAAKLLEIFYHLQKDSQRNENYSKLYPHSGADNRFLQDAVAYMKAHYDEKLTLERLGEATGYSPNYFRKIFKEVLGVSPQKYLESIRIAQAKYQLLSTTLPLAEIAYGCGFSSQAHFSLAFKSATGTTPNAFRAAAVADYLL